MITRQPADSEMRQAVRACLPYFGPTALFGAGVNLLYLASPIYLLQVYDRVVNSGSVPTLMMLTLALLLALAAMAGLDFARAEILIRAGLRLDRILSQRVMAAMMRQASASGGAGRSQALRDLDTFRQFITGPSFYALFDAPWTPIYLIAITLLHPLLGAFALGCAVILLGLAIVNQRLTSRLLTEAGEAATRNYAVTEASLRNGHVVEGLGMMPGLLARWSRDRYLMLGAQAQASDRGAALQGVIRFLRMAMQSLILGVGAYLVIEREATGGIMFAGMFLLGRTLMPIDTAVGAWRQLVGGRNAYRRVEQLLGAHPPPPASLRLPRPKGRLVAESTSLYLPGLSRPVLHDVRFEIEPGETIGIIGPSGAGKSTLARLIVGIQAPSAGTIRLDGADVATWDRTELGRYIGYLPQEIELFGETVAANIARLGEGDDEAIIEAAMAAGVHEMILSLPRGYETLIDDGGANLSGGHRQRIGLARALYGDPSLFVLDEPSSNLDFEGEAALDNCLARLKEMRRTVVVISHRLATLNTVDKLLVLQNGVVRLFGGRSDVLAKLGRPVPLEPAAIVGQHQATAGA